MSTFANAKATHIFSAKIFNDQSFNDMLTLTNDIASFEQLGLDVLPHFIYVFKATGMFLIMTKVDVLKFPTLYSTHFWPHFCF